MSFLSSSTASTGINVDDNSHQQFSDMKSFSHKSFADYGWPTKSMVECFIGENLSHSELRRAGSTRSNENYALSTVIKFMLVVNFIFMKINDFKVFNRSSLDIV